MSSAPSSHLSDVSTGAAATPSTDDFLYVAHDLNMTNDLSLTTTATSTGPYAV